MIHHNHFPELPDDFLHFSEEEGSDIPEIEEVDETSVEDVLADLERFDQELRRTGKLEPPTVEEQYLTETGGEAGILPELSEQSLEAFAGGLKTVWARLGLADPRNITLAQIENLRPEVLLQLDKYRAESLYFDTAKKVWQKLGSEPVTAARLMAQLQPPDNPSKPARGVDLDKLRTEQKSEGLAYLRRIKIDEDQLFSMMVGPTPKQQNIIRLAYVLQEEPALKDLREFLGGKGNKKRPKVLKSEEVIDMIVMELSSYMRQYIEARQRMKAGYEWESIDYEQYNRAMSQAYYSLRLADQIQKDMRIE
ncbi:hypothetical protein HYS84_03095 [Candidatus Saccharibacteria bacterium]|nr:hypothetical protein [Candidatus Saccharibacteria bacterium]